MLKLYSLSLLLALGSLPVFAQRPKPAAATLPPTDTVYFDLDWERTETLEEVTYARIARHDGASRLPSFRSWGQPRPPQLGFTNLVAST